MPRKINNSVQAISVAQQQVTKRGSSKREDSNYDIEQRFSQLEREIASLRADIKEINDKIVIVQKVTRDKNGKETIVVKQ